MTTGFASGPAVGRIGIPALLFLIGLLSPASFPPGAEADSRPPQTRIVAGEKGLVTVITRRARSIFRYRSDSRPARFECSLDARPWRACGRRSSRWFTGPGRHRLRVRAVDADGTRDPTPAVRAWRVVRWRPDLRAASRFAASREGVVSFSVDLGWRTFGRRQGLRAPMASTVKVMLMAAFLRQRKIRNRRLTGYEKELLVPMITVSDNYSANTVASIVGPDRVRALASGAGLRSFEYSTTWGLSRISAADQARFMRALPGLLPERHRTWGLGLLKRITASQRWGLPGVRPKGWRLFFKGGWGISDGRFAGTVNHQVALLRRGGHRVGISILTQGNPWTSYGEKTLRGVAQQLVEGLPRVRGS